MKNLLIVLTPLIIFCIGLMTLNLRNRSVRGVRDRYMNASVKYIFERSEPGTPDGWTLKPRATKLYLACRITTPDAVDFTLNMYHDRKTIIRTFSMHAEDIKQLIEKGHFETDLIAAERDTLPFAIFVKDYYIIVFMTVLEGGVTENTMIQISARTFNKMMRRLAIQMATPRAQFSDHFDNEIQRLVNSR